MSFDDESAARELDLYAENESALYNQFKSIIENLKRKISSGKYDAAKAPKLWMYWYDAAAKRYVKEFGGDVRTAFPASLRNQLAKERSKDEHQKILGGEYGAVVMKTVPASKLKRAKLTGWKATGICPSCKARSVTAGNCLACGWVSSEQKTKRKRSSAHRGAPKRHKTGRGTQRRRAMRRLHRVRKAVRQRGWGVMRAGHAPRPISAGDRITWVSAPWGHRLQGRVTAASSSGRTIAVTQDNGAGGVIDLSSDEGKSVRRIS